MQLPPGKFRMVTFRMSMEPKRQKNLDELPVHNNTIGGYTGGRKTRCTDKFVRYPYPKTLGTVHQKEYKDKLKKTVVLKNGESFNLEKEAKIINPHKMDLATTAATNFKGHSIEPKRKVLR